MEAFSALLAIFAGNSPFPGEFPAQRPVTRSFDFFFDLNKWLSKQWWGWWFGTPSCPLWRHSNVFFMLQVVYIRDRDLDITDLVNALAPNDTGPSAGAVLNTQVPSNL